MPSPPTVQCHPPVETSYRQTLFVPEVKRFLCMQLLNPLLMWSRVEYLYGMDTTCPYLCVMYPHRMNECSWIVRARYILFYEGIYRMDEKELQKLHAATQYTRLLLLKLLLKEPAYAGQLERKLKEEEGKKVERRVVSAHLAELERYGLVEGKHEIGKERPVTLKIFKITPRGKAVYNHIMAFK